MSLLASRKTGSASDAIVVGSKTAGRQTANTLARTGVKVLMREAGRNCGGEVPGQSYTPASDEPKLQFHRCRARLLGGSTHHSGRIPLRNGPHDFKGRRCDALACDWAISYYDIAPYHTKSELSEGVNGSNKGRENAANFPTQPRKEIAATSTHQGRPYRQFPRRATGSSR